MNQQTARLLGARARDYETGRMLSSAHGYSPSVVISLGVFLLSWLLLSASCSSVQSSVTSLVTGESPTDPTYAGRQHFPVTPNEAVACLIAIAPREGWKVVSSGAEYSAQGAAGAFFRIEPVEPHGDTAERSGIFYAEPSGSYVRVSEQSGLPESLVEPLIAEIKKRRRE